MCTGSGPYIHRAVFAASLFKGMNLEMMHKDLYTDLHTSVAISKWMCSDVSYFRQFKLLYVNVCVCVWGGGVDQGV
jgi:hypothetical protein